MSAPNFFIQNAFRTLRVSASASHAQILDAAEQMKRAAALDALDSLPADRADLGPIGRGESDLRAAIDRLESPATRLRDRTFWFHLTAQQLPAQLAETLLKKYADDPEAYAAVSHDLALEEIAQCCSSAETETTGRRWVHALTSWRKVLHDENYLSLVFGLEERGSFEPVALPSEIEALKDDAFSAVVEHVALLGRRAIESKSEHFPKGVLSSLTSINDKWSIDLQRQLLQPTIQEIEGLSERIQSYCKSKTIREHGNERSNQAACLKALAEFRNDLEPKFELLDRLCGKDHDEARHVGQERIKVLQTLAYSFTWAEDFEKSEQLLKEALQHDTIGIWKDEVEESLDDIGATAALKRVLSPLQPIDSAPFLGSLNGFGFTLYGHDEYDGVTKSHIAVYYFIALFIPIFPIRRYRVVEESGNRFRFLGKLPLRKFDVIHLSAAICLIIGGVLFSAAQNEKKPVSYSYTPTYAPSQARAYTPPSPPPVRSKQSQLSELKARIDAGRTEGDALDARLKPVTQRIEALKAQLDEYKVELRRLDALGSSVDVTYYNSMVAKHNAVLENIRALYGANKSDFDRYNQLVEMDQKLVAEYNSLLRR